jgi:hypothetical protein
MATSLLTSLVYLDTSNYMWIPTNFSLSVLRSLLRCAFAFTDTSLIVNLAGGLLLVVQVLSFELTTMSSISRFAFPDDQYYEEETAFIFHDGKNSGTDGGHRLRTPLPPPRPIPEIPTGLGGDWKWKQDRHLSVDFTALDVIPEADALFFSHMIQRDDIVLTAKGAFKRTQSPDDFLNKMESILGNRNHKSFRRFDRDKKLGWKEADDTYSMFVRDFVRLSRQTIQVRDQLLNDENASVDREFKYMDTATKEERIIDVTKTTMYLTDLELQTQLPTVEAEFKDGFKLKDILPGGALDLMEGVRKKLFMTCLSEKLTHDQCHFCY